MTNINEKEQITLGGGCFWCVEALYQELEGVEKVVSGYAGGTVKNPTYQAVCNGTTGHAEVIQITFDKKKITNKEIIEIFLTVHDPTTLNRQGADVGTQYRSIILYKTEEQKKIAEQVKKEFEKEKIWSEPIVTEIKALEEFYEAEEYHQNYYKNNTNQSYCRVVITPKVAKFRKKYLQKLKKEVVQAL